MTDHPTPTDDDLSLALDGEADAELLARIDADPAARARLEQLRGAAGLVGDATVPPLDDDVVDQLIATAVDTPMAPPRPASSRASGATPWLVAAAVIVLMAIGLSLVWAGRSTDEDQASATKSDAATLQESSDATESSGGSSDSSFSAGDAGAESEMGLPGGHGAPTTTAATASRSADLPVLYLGSYPSGAKLREATARSFADAWKASGSPLVFDADDSAPEDSANARLQQEQPSARAVSRCADQLRVTLSLQGDPIQTGYATVDDKPVLVYEFATTSARSDAPTTLVAAVGVDACDEVVIFER
ncbi:hypothetical protein ACE2AJ_11285 [Aquihabitans daechungensis]|uniref:hypothetical protein n=1 Tax=Aquihabitans daechungensis TaxID=1052257 RepID=UPI003B9FC6A2